MSILPEFSINSSYQNTVAWWDGMPYRTRHHDVNLTLEFKVPEWVSSNLYTMQWNVHTEQESTLIIDGVVVFCGQAQVDAIIRGKFTHIIISPTVPEVVTITAVNNATSPIPSPSR